MKQVHARFTGTMGTLAQFGDSITVTMAYWAPLEGEPRQMPPEMARAHARVKKYMRPECWRNDCDAHDRCGGGCPPVHRKRSEDDRRTDRHQHSTTQALDDAERNELVEGLRQAAQHGADREQTRANAAYAPASRR